MHLVLTHDLLVLTQLVQSVNAMLVEVRTNEPLRTHFGTNEAKEICFVIDDPFSSDRVEVNFEQDAISMQTWRGRQRVLATRYVREQAWYDAQALAKEIAHFFTGSTGG